MKNEKVDMELPQSAKDFLEYLRVIKNKADGTLSGYNSDLCAFFDFIITYKDKKKINNNFIKGITLKDLYAFMQDLEKKIVDKDGKEKSKNSPATRARKVACIKSYFNYLQNKAKIITYNPAYELETPKIPDKEIAYLNIEQSKSLLESLDKNNINYLRDYCILTLFLNTGLRAEELTTIKIDMIKEDVITINGKGSKIRKAFLNEDCLKAIKEYLDYRKQDDDKVPEEERIYLFLSNRKQRIRKITIQNLVKKHLGEANFGDEYHTHSLRASFCTNLYKNGVGIRTLQKLMGHSVMTTTQRYIEVDDQDMREATKKIY